MTCLLSSGRSVSFYRSDWKTDTAWRKWGFYPSFLVRRKQMQTDHQQTRFHSEITDKNPTWCVPSFREGNSLKTAYKDEKRQCGGKESALNNTKKKKPVTAVQSGVCGDWVEKMSLRRREGKNKETVIDISGLRGAAVVITFYWKSHPGAWIAIFCRVWAKEN